MRPEDLFETMVQRIERECREIRAAAAEQARAIAEEAEQEAQQHREARLAEQHAANQARIEAAHRQGQARLTLDESGIRHQVAEEILEQAAAELQRFARSPEFPPVLEKLLHEALDAVPGAAVVQVPEAHLEQCRTWLEQRGEIPDRIEARPGLIDGVIVSHPAGGLRVTNTLASRFERRKDEARRLCIRLLFDGAAT